MPKPYAFASLCIGLRRLDLQSLHFIFPAFTLGRSALILPPHFMQMKTLGNIRFSASGNLFFAIFFRLAIDCEEGDSKREGVSRHLQSQVRLQSKSI